MRCLRPLRDRPCRRAERGTAWPPDAPRPLAGSRAEATLSEAYDQLWNQSWAEASELGPGFRSRHTILLRQLEASGVAGRLLDVGAGRGRFVSLLHQHFPGLELSVQEPAPGAREHLDRLDFVAAVHSELPTPDEGLGHDGFDAIVCSEVLEHVDGDREMLEGMHAILRPGGRLYLTVPLRQALWTAVDDAVGHRRRYEHGQLAGLCSSLGMVVEVERAVGFPLYNSYYRLLGRRGPRAAGKASRSALGRLAAGLAARAFVAEAAFDSRWGGRGLVVARKASFAGTTSS